MGEKILQIEGAVAKLARNLPEVYLEQNPAQAVEQKPRRVLVETSTYDENGELVSQISRPFRQGNGSGFVISYTEKMCEFLEKVTAGSIVRVFLYIAQRQSYGNDGRVFGYRTSHKFLRQVLRLDRSTLWDALKFLKDNYLVHVGKFDGTYEFMVNPQYITIGSDKKTRMNEWNRRWAQTFKEASNHGKG